jgi:hypothetical protein
MGFKSPNTNDAISILSRALIEVNSPYNDGITAFEIKKKLYTIKFVLDYELCRGATFAGEEEFLNECEQKMIWSILKNDIK